VQQTFMKVSILITVILALIIIGGGLYFVMNQNTASQIPQPATTTPPIQLATSTSPITENTIPPGYRGLYVISSPFSGKNYYPVPSNIVSTSTIDGVYVSLEWNAVEPSQGTYDWSSLDPLISEALQYGKKVEIGVTGGGYSPTWLSTDGVPENNFIINPSSTPGGCHSVTIPTYWHPTYISSYVLMIQALAAHLKSIGGYSAVRIVKIDGINLNTEENYIPAQTPTTANSLSCTTPVSDAVAIWQSAGYTPKKIIDAWTQMAIGIGQAFPDKLLAMDILETGSAFPFIDNQGNKVNHFSKTFVDVTNTLINNALVMFSGRIAIQWDALSQFSLAKYAPDVFAAHAKGAVIGWQTNGRGGTTLGTLCGISVSTLYPCDNAGYQTILDNGISTGGAYIELMPVNVVEFPQALKEAQGKLK
jgi:hypothetical protein